MKFKSIPALVIAAATMFFSCAHLQEPSHGIVDGKDPSAPGAVQLVHINKDTLTVISEYSRCLKGSVYPADAENQELVWSSLDEQVASVNDTGLVVGLKAGITKVVLSSKTLPLTDTCVVVVVENIHVGSVALDKTEATLHFGDKLKLEATINPVNARITTLEWASDNKAVATVNEKGEVEPVTEGVAHITVTSVDGGKTATCTVTVERIKVTGISLNRDNITIAPEDVTVLTATIAPANATNPKYHWSSSNEAVAVVDGGRVYGVTEGDAVITVTAEDGGFTAQCAVTVKSKQPGLQSLVLDFDFSGAALPGWPTASHAHTDGGDKCIYPLNGVNYEFILADCDGASKCQVWWNSAGYLVMNNAYRYIGFPAIPGYKLVKIVGTHATKNSTTRNVGVVAQIEANTTHPDAEGGHGWVSGGEPIAWTTQGDNYTYDLYGTKANTVYYLYMRGSGVGASHFTLTYDPE